MGERLNGIQEVEGSIPFGSTMLILVSAVTCAVFMSTVEILKAVHDSNAQLDEGRVSAPCAACLQRRRAQAYVFGCLWGAQDSRLGEQRRPRLRALTSS